MTMVMSAAVPIGHVVTALVPDSLNQQMNGLAQKLQIDVAKLRSVIPQPDYPDEDSQLDRFK
jgi:hypothetical protein